MKLFYKSFNKKFKVNKINTALHEVKSLFLMLFRESVVFFFESKTIFLLCHWQKCFTTFIFIILQSLLDIQEKLS